MTVKAVVFDMDGTLVDSVDLHTKAWQDAPRRFGKDVRFDASGRRLERAAIKLFHPYSVKKKPSG